MVKNFSPFDHAGSPIALGNYRPTLPKANQMLRYLQCTSSFDYVSAKLHNDVLPAVCMAKAFLLLPFNLSHTAYPCSSNFSAKQNKEPKIPLR